MSLQSEEEVRAAHKRIEEAMESEIDSLMATRAKAVKTIGVAVAPANHVQGRKIAGARHNDRKTQTWRPQSYRCERLERN